MTGETFGQMLRRFRTERGLSQTQLARRAGVDPAYVNRLERGGQKCRGGSTIPIDRRPRSTVVLALSEVLDVSTSQTDRLLFAAGLATQADWQTRAVRAETALASIQQAFVEAVEAASAMGDAEDSLWRRTG